MTLERHKPEKVENPEDLVWCVPHGCTGKSWWALSECEYSKAYGLDGKECDLLAVIQLSVGVPGGG